MCTDMYIGQKIYIHTAMYIHHTLHQYIIKKRFSFFLLTINMWSVLCSVPQAKFDRFFTISSTPKMEERTTAT